MPEKHYVHSKVRKITKILVKVIDDTCILEFLGKVAWLSTATDCARVMGPPAPAPSSPSTARLRVEPRPPAPLSPPSGRDTLVNKIKRIKKPI
jgi:hypothetical protein